MIVVGESKSETKGSMYKAVSHFYGLPSILVYIQGQWLVISEGGTVIEKRVDYISGTHQFRNTSVTSIMSMRVMHTSTPSTSLDTIGVRVGRVCRMQHSPFFVG